MFTLLRFILCVCLCASCVSHSPGGWWFSSPVIRATHTRAVWKSSESCMKITMSIYKWWIKVCQGPSFCLFETLLCSVLCPKFWYVDTLLCSTPCTLYFLANFSMVVLSQFEYGCCALSRNDNILPLYAALQQGFSASVPTFDWKKMDGWVYILSLIQSWVVVAPG